MHGAVFVIAATIALVAGAPNSARIMGGSVTTIDRYPYGAAMLVTWNGVNFIRSCGGTIINNRSILSAAHCFYATNTNQWRIRVGSSFASSGGVVHNAVRLILHPNYNTITLDSDIAIVHSATAFSFNNNVRVGSIAGPNYNVADDQVVYAIGWGLIGPSGPSSEQLRHVQIWTVNQNLCRNSYGSIINDNMICAGWYNVGGRSQCSGDSGGPLIHNGVVIGVCSFGSHDCGHPLHPSVNVRVSRYTNWIQVNS